MGAGEWLFALGVNGPVLCTWDSRRPAATSHAQLESLGESGIRTLRGENPEGMETKDEGGKGLSVSGCSVGSALFPQS